MFPVKDLRIIASSGLTEERLKFLREVFFPQTKNLDDLKSILYNPWNTSPDGKWTDALQKSWEARTQQRTDLATMPYNVMANKSSSVAIGTKAKGENGQPIPGISMLTGEWPTWQTASRSCVIRLEPTANAAKSAKPLVGDLLPWGCDDRKVTDAVVPFATPAPASGTQFDLYPNDKVQRERCYGVKTGESDLAIMNQDG